MHVPLATVVLYNNYYIQEAVGVLLRFLLRISSSFFLCLKLGVNISYVSFLFLTIHPKTLLLGVTLHSDSFAEKDGNYHTLCGAVLMDDLRT